MKNYIVLWITLFTSHCLLANPSTSLEDGSFFDYLTQKAGMPFDGSKLDVNRDPFESLLSKLKQHASFFTAVIPYGRSLQKMAGFPEPLKYPRVVLGSWQNKTELNHLLRGRLFIGYVEPSKKLEIISYNPSLGKFDFQIVENFFPGGKAKVKPAPRNICMKCHRDGMPLFAGGDWLETTGFNKTLFKLAKEKIGSEFYKGISLRRQSDDTLDYVSQPERLDDMTYHGALLVGYQRAFNEICSYDKSSSKDCKRKIILWMILSNIDKDLSPILDRELLDAFVAVVGDGTINISQHNIPDHNPTSGGKLSFAMPASVDPSGPRSKLGIVMASKNDPVGIQYYKSLIFFREMGRAFFTDKDLLAIKERFGKKRTVSIEASSNHFNLLGNLQKSVQNDRCLIDAKKSLKILQGKINPKTFDLQCFDKGMNLLTESIKSLPLDHKGIIDRSKILRNIDRNMKTKLSENLCCKVNRVKFEPEKSQLPEDSITAEMVRTPELKQFLNYCSECHLMQDIPRPFLAQTSESDLLKQIKSMAPLIAMRLRYEHMPPSFAQKKLPQAVRQQLIEYLKKIRE